MAHSQTTRDWGLPFKIQWCRNLQVRFISIYLYYQLQPNKHCSWSLIITSSHLNTSFLPDQRILNVSAGRPVILQKGVLLSTCTENAVGVEYLICCVLVKTNKRQGTHGLFNRRIQTEIQFSLPLLSPRRRDGNTGMEVYPYCWCWGLTTLGFISHGLHL